MPAVFTNALSASLRELSDAFSVGVTSYTFASTIRKTFNTIAFVTRSAPARKRSLGVNALSVQVAVVLKRLALINIEATCSISCPAIFANALSTTFIKDTVRVHVTTCSAARIIQSTVESVSKVTILTLAVKGTLSVGAVGIRVAFVDQTSAFVFIVAISPISFPSFLTNTLLTSAKDKLDALGVLIALNPFTSVQIRDAAVAAVSLETRPATAKV